mgnify:CR=1 FL=1
MPELADIIPPIVPPPAPVSHGWLIAALILVSLLLLALLFWQRRRSRQPRLALKKLRRTELGLRAGKLNPRRAVFEIGAVLKHLSVKPASKRRARSYSAATPAEEWASFMQALDESRYAAPEPDMQNTSQLLAQARRWIKRTAC